MQQPWLIETDDVARRSTFDDAIDLLTDGLKPDPVGRSSVFAGETDPVLSSATPASHTDSPEHPEQGVAASAGSAFADARRDVADHAGTPGVDPAVPPRRGPAPSTSVHNRRGPRSRGRLVTPRDLELLATVVELRLVTVPLLFQWLFPDAVAVTVVNNWLGRMSDLGLMTSQPRVTSGGRKVYRPTERTYELLDVAGRPRELRSDEHTLAVAETYLMLRDQGWTVTSERQIALAARTPGKKQVRAGDPWTMVGASMHQPDLVVRRRDTTWQVEVETTTKDQRRYDDLLDGYARSVASGFTTGVTYVVGEGGRVKQAALEIKVRAAAERARRRLETDTSLGMTYTQPVPRLRREWWSVRVVPFSWDRRPERRRRSG